MHNNLHPGYIYVVPQSLENCKLYNPEHGLKHGTLFSDLDIPVGVYEANGEPYDRCAPCRMECMQYV